MLWVLRLQFKCYHCNAINKKQDHLCYSRPMKFHSQYTLTEEISTASLTALRGASRRGLVVLVVLAAQEGDEWRM